MSKKLSKTKAAAMIRSIDSHIDRWTKIREEALEIEDQDNADRQIAAWNRQKREVLAQLIPRPGEFITIL